MSDKDTQDQRQMPTVIVSELAEDTDMTSEVNVSEVGAEDAKSEAFTGEEALTPKQESALRKALKDAGIADRYKVDDDDELMREMAKTIANGDREIKHLQQNLDQITPLAHQALRQYQQPPAQQQQQQRSGETEEERRAREFVERIQSEQLEQRLNPVMQQIQTLQTDNFILQKAASDPEFAEAYKSGALARQFQTLVGAPYSPQAVEFAYLQMRDQQLPQKIAAAQTALTQQVERKANDKKAGFVEGGGRPIRETRTKADMLLEKAGNLTSDQIIAEMRRLGITKE